MRGLINFLLSGLAVMIAAYLLPGVHVGGFLIALAVAIVLALINTFIRPILIILTLPLNVLTLGLFTFILNALLIMLTSAIVPGFTVDSFWWALLFSLLLALVNYAIGKLKRE